ncbi:MAG: branched-chain amino acid ABC transporter ATP-binding protein/permease [Actinobacteria bacterium]|nr:branched-chain amino acid ABC transporter ATP-binding protein/permease [Actinomycetota bacterium]
MGRQRQLQGVLLAGLVILPFLPGTSDLLGSAAQAATFTIVASSLVLLTGWVGQISLAHAAFVGVGAYATGWAAGRLGLTFPLSMPVAVVVAGLVAGVLGVVALRVRGLYLAVATLIFSWAASEFLFRQEWLLANSSVPPQAIGTPGTLLSLDFSSRRVYYFVAWAVAIALLYALMNLRDSKTGRAFYAIRGSEMAAASLGVNVLRYKSLAFALSGAMAGIAGNLMITHSRVVSPDAFDFTGSLFFLAIAVVGGLLSLGGAVAAAFVFAALEEVFFRVTFLNEFLQLVSAGLLAAVFLAYPGGLAALAASMGERWRDLRRRGGQAVEKLIVIAETGAKDPPTEEPAPSSAEEASGDTVDEASTDTVEIEAVPAGRLAAAVPRARHRLLRGLALTVAVLHRRLARRSRDERVPPVLELDRLVTADHQPADHPTADVASGGGGLASAVSEPSGNGHRPASSLAQIERTHDGETTSSVGTVPRDQRAALIEADQITVRFGGLTAVDNASLTVREGEITGLIGPNGAGKTTLFNAIAGYNQPTEGTVRLYGVDVTGLPVHQRAELGVARTFQLIQLFGQLTVFENLLAATHLQNATGFIQHMAVTPQALEAEARARARVRRVIELLDLGDVAQRLVAGLPFGVLRMVEVARALVSGARVVMLDEPASGLDERETDQLMDVLRFVRGLGATLLLIEHDIRMVTSVTDYLYVLNQGAIIAEGTPGEIQRNPDVIAAYLGVSEPETVGS